MVKYLSCLDIETDWRGIWGKQSVTVTVSWIAHALEIRTYCQEALLYEFHSPTAHSFVFYRKKLSEQSQVTVSGID
jgi:hypothetical protein